MQDHVGGGAESAPERGEDAGRRTVLKWAIGGLSGAIAAMLAWPMVSFFAAPAYRKAVARFFAVAKDDQIPAGEPVKLTFPVVKEDAFLREKDEHQVWAIKKAAGELVVFSPICPHLGCYYSWNAARKEFVCPCHNSVFSEDGKLLSGPSPRSLDTLRHKVVDGTVMVEWQRFKLGTSEKIPM